MLILVQMVIIPLKTQIEISAKRFFREQIEVCSRFLPFQKVNVFVNGRSAQITNSCQFADIEVSALVGGVVPEKSRRKVIHGYLRPPDLLPLCPCVRHPRPHTGADHSQFQLTEHARHL